MKLRELRMNARISQKELAKLLDIPQQTLSNYETGKNEPDIYTLIKFADFFNVSLDMMCGRSRPYDLPSTASPEHKKCVKILLQLNKNNALRAASYCEGLLSNQNELEQGKFYEKKAKELSEKLEKRQK